MVTREIEADNLSASHQADGGNNSGMKRTLLLVLAFSGVYVLSTNLFREYHYVSSPKTWAEAQRYCRETYADLATVDSPEENDRLLLELQGSGQFAWIGLYDNTTGWKWTMGEDDFVGNNNFPPWEVNQPDNYDGKQSCIVMNWVGGWRDEICKTDRPFICFDARCVVVKPDPGKLSGSLQFREQSVIFLWAVHGGQVGVRLSAVPLSFSPRLGAAHVVVLTKQVGRQNINPRWLHAKMEADGLTDFKLRWMERDGQIFHKEPKKKT
ncbi:hypothetical protein CCH79_00008561 [Gambusia affinis]|uniref:C-type lectin domain-containing protein n=1 Tax=Gambusia affinis TaxID=33528 RepID=A0A315UUU7_GAMAF|nr:hypothetical protein CCH79_00008561 [Gambusia affinis]